MPSSFFSFVSSSSSPFFFPPPPPRFLPLFFPPFSSSSSSVSSPLFLFRLDFALTISSSESESENRSKSALFAPLPTNFADVSYNLSCLFFINSSASSKFSTFLDINCLKLYQVSIGNAQKSFVFCAFKM